MRSLAPLGVLLLVALWCVGASAQVYQCTAADGARSFQDRPCPSAARQRVLDLPARAPAGADVPAPSPPAAVSVPSAASVADVAPAAVTPAPSTPLPTLYACVGAVNQEHYLAREPRPPYLVPLGVLGYPPQSLAQAYGGRRGAGASAPELARPRVGGPRSATGMTEVQDFCLPAAPAQVCSWVQKEYAENHRKLRMAMPHEAPPLEARERHLAAQLDHC
jgi:hypothetical protein